MKLISGEFLAHQLASKLCELNGWADNSDEHTLAQIHYRESLERGISEGILMPYSPITLRRLKLDNRLFEDATFSEQEVMDYLKSEMPLTTSEDEKLNEEIKKNIISDNLQPWFIKNLRDPNPSLPWYIPARYFARQLVKDDSTLLTKTSLLADKVAQSLAKAGVFKRGGKKLFSPETVKKSFANVIFNENFETSSESLNIKISESQ